MKLVHFQCQECNREFVMTEADAVDEGEMSCPVDSCQGEVDNLDDPDDEEAEEASRSSGRGRRNR